MKHLATPVSARLFTSGLLIVLTSAASATTIGLVGTVKTGNNPIQGAAVTLYDAGHDRGVAPTILGTATSDSNGSFQIVYGTPATGEVIYLIAKGPAPSIDLAAIVGVGGGSFGSSTQTVVINELTTIASAWAMAQFMRGDNIGGKSPGLQNAAATAANMANVATGMIGSVLAAFPNGSNTTTMAEFNSLANLIAACIDGTAAVCAQLFTGATPPGGVTPTDTLQAAMSISHNPWNSVSSLFTLSQANSDYSPALTSAPDAWTIALMYYGNGTEFDGPGNMAVDADGNLFITNNYDGQVHACGAKLLSKLTPTGLDAPGAPFSGGGISGQGFGVTIDPVGNIWTGNFGFKGSQCTEGTPAKSVSQFTPTGVALSPNITGWIGRGLIHSPQATVSDAAGDIWIANFTKNIDYVTEIVGGNPNNVKTYINDPILKESFGIALDAQSNIWLTSGPNLVTKLNPTTGQYHSYTAPGMDRPLGVAIDSLGNVWVANVEGQFDSTDAGPGSVVAFDPNGNPLPGSPFTGGGINGAWGIAVDGNDNVWVSDWVGEHVTELCGARTQNCPQGLTTGQGISPATGYTSNAMQRLTGIVIDQAGNVWVPNNWKTIPIQTNPGGNGMVELVGAAGPVKAPVWGPPQQP